MAFEDYSTTASENATVGSVNFAEGQGANTLNNSNREVMKDLHDGAIMQVPDFATMTALTKSKQADGTVISCRAKTTEGDGLGDTFRWDSSATDTANGTTILAADAGGTGRWIALNNGNIVQVPDPTDTGGSSGVGIFQKETFVYRLTQDENTQKQWFTLTIANIENISATMRIEANIEMSGTISPGSSVSWWRLSQTTAGSAPQADLLHAINLGFGGIDTPTVSGDDITFGGSIQNNSTTETATIDLYITLYYDTRTNFTFTGLDGTTNHTGTALTDTFAINRNTLPLSDNVYNLGGASNLWKEVFAGIGTINTSDGRMKQQIEDPADAVLDAWGSVPIKVYKMDDAVKEKGPEKARLHAGVVTQDIEQAFQSGGLSAGDYGLYIKDQGANGQEFLGIRPTECLFLEAALQRREIAALKAQIAALTP